MPALSVGGVLVEHAPGRRLVIGRSESADVQVDHPLVSRRHALAEARQGGWVLSDLGSRNGMFAGGERVERAEMDATTVVRLGNASDGPVVEIVVEPDAAQAGPGPDAPHEPEVEPAAHGRARPVLRARSDLRPGGEGAAPRLGELRTVYEVLAERVRIGRAADNDLTLVDDLRASRHHGELLRAADGSWSLLDLDSHNGTFVNGVRVRRSRVVDGDLVSIGNRIFRFSQGTLEEYEATGASFEAVGLSAWGEGGIRLVSNVSLSLGPSSMLAVVGPSGVGKTSLLNALTGFRPAAEGTVFFGGRDLYANYDDLRRRMGYVPQEDIVHTQLPVRQALRYAAELRFGPDVGRAEREARVEEVIAELGLASRVGTPIERLSGGERKRVSVGIEMLTKPSLLLLDEPTSGLDPGNEEQVMRLLRELADGGRVIVVVTHSLQSIDMADRVLFLASGGTEAYYGPPSERASFFARHGCTGGDAEVFRELARADGVDWQERFRADPLYDEHVALPLRRANVTRSAARLRPPLPARPELPWTRQAAVLVRRQAALLRADRRTAMMLAVQAPVFGAIDVLLFPTGSISTSRGPFAALLVWLMVMGVTWLGTSNTAREIVKEHAVYRRERSVGLSVGAYVASKAAVFGVVALLQAIVLFAVALARQHLPPADPDHVMASLQQALPSAFDGLNSFTRGAALASPTLELALDVVLAGFAATGLGLLVSAAVKRSDQAMVVLPIVLVAQIALSMPLLAMQNPSTMLRVLGFFSSAQWGTAAGAATVSLNQLLTSYQLSLTSGGASISYLLGHPLPRRFVAQQALRAVAGYGQWNHSPAPWLLAVAMLVFMTAAALAGTWLVLHRRDAELLASPLAADAVRRRHAPRPSRARSR